MAHKASGATLNAGGREVAVSNLDKPMFPAGFTKAQVIDYYIRVAPYLLPHLKDRPLTLKRYPNGVAGKFFYEKDAPLFTPKWVATFPTPRRGGGAPIRYVLIQDLATLVWCANLANLEMHPFLHRAPALNTPDSLVFDLDPGEGAGIRDCAEVAFLLKALLDGFGLRSFPKVSGSKGLQIHVPLNDPRVRYDATRAFAKAVAQALEHAHPKLVVSEMAKSARAGKVFVDWSQNSDFKTTVGVYSMRAKREHPLISMPVKWDELAGTEAKLSWQPADALERLSAVGDLFQPVLPLKQKLTGAGPKKPARAPRASAAPSKTTLRRSRQGGRRRFLIQEHARKSLLRLEMEDTVKSWEVTSLAAPVPLPAIPAPDEPIASFNPESSDVQDAGVYDMMEGSYEQGHLRIYLKGKTVDGEWMMTRDGAVWTIANAGAPELPEARIKFVEPMAAKLVAALPEGEPWTYEIKLDGYRALALRGEHGVELLSRNNNSFTARFREIAAACERIPANTICDGEIVALDPKGRPAFNLLQNWHSSSAPLKYYVFDLLAYQGKSLLKLPLVERRRILDVALEGVSEPVRVLGVVVGTPAELIRAAREQSLEGFVAKRADSVYEVGQRSGAWVKFKVNQGQELVAGGYIPGGKHYFESLLVGYWEGNDLMFIGKVRNGFTPKSREELFRRMEALRTTVCPFANLPEPKNARRGEALTADVMAKCQWLSPELVVQVEYTDWTEANHLRHSKFAGVREDKDAREVRHEHP